MKLHILFGQRKCRYEGEYGPEALLVWDEFAVEENPEGYEEALNKEREKYGQEMSAMRVILVRVDGAEIIKLLNQAPVVPGEIAGVER